MGDSTLDKAKETLGYSGDDAQKNAVKDGFGAFVGATYETLANHAGDGGKVLRRLGAGIGTTMDGFDAVQNYKKGNYRDALGNVCSAGGSIAGGAVVGALATPETLGAATIPAALAGGYAGGKAGEASCKWIYDKISQNTPIELNDAVQGLTLSETEQKNLLAAVQTALPQKYRVNDAYVENGVLSVQYVNANNSNDDRVRDYDIDKTKNISMDESVQVAQNREQTLQADLINRQQNQGMSIT